MLIHPFLMFVHSGIRIATVILSGRIVTVPHVIIPVVALGRDVWVRCIVVNGSIASMSDGVVPIGVLSVYVHMVGLKLVYRVVSGCRHLHLPEGVLRVHAAAVV